MVMTPRSEMIPAWDGPSLVPREKLDVHRRGLRHPAISVFVMAGDAVLLQQRAAGKYHTPLLWTNTCCTHPHWGETAADCARRRLWQEMGIEGLVLRPAAVIEYRADVGAGLTEHEVVDLFLAEADRSLVLNPDPAEVQDVAWMNVGELVRDVKDRPARYTPWLRIYLAEHGQAIFEAPSLSAR
jgi:isopentenyl-diphosphate delta-isomerase